MELQALADVGKRHVISLAMLIVLVVGIGQMQQEAVVPALDAHLDHAGRGSRLDSVVDGRFPPGAAGASAAPEPPRWPDPPAIRH